MRSIRSRSLRRGWGRRVVDESPRSSFAVTVGRTVEAATATQASRQRQPRLRWGWFCLLQSFLNAAFLDGRLFKAGGAMFSLEGDDCYFYENKLSWEDMVHFPLFLCFHFFDPPKFVHVQQLQRTTSCLVALQMMKAEQRQNQRSSESPSKLTRTTSAGESPNLIIRSTVTSKDAWRPVSQTEHLSKTVKMSPECIWHAFADPWK